ncbi:MAG: hypothetical protein POELPBGB_01210 [Bacteroidia bacterium]|nr:hypothetical protein [Bacteroidia bacterium]
MNTKFTLFIILCLGVFSKAYAQPEAGFYFPTDTCFDIYFTDISTCNGCTIQSWLWDFGDGSTSTQQYPSHIYTSAGTYNVTLTVTDNNSNVDTVIHAVPVTCMDVQILADGQPVDCFFDGCADLQVLVTGGTPPYTYLWSHGESTSPIEVCVTGTFNVIVTDMMGQQGFASITLSSQYDVNTSINHEGCGSSDGSISVDISNGTEFSYLWSPGGQTTSTITGLTAGDYSVTLSDTTGCEETLTYTVFDSCGYISGSVFSDANNNGIFDVGENPFLAGSLQTTGNDVYETQVGSDGSFTIIVGNGTYTTNFIPQLNYHAVNPTNHLSQINNSYDSVDFAVTPIPGNPDLQIFINPITAARPGFNATYKLIAINIGTDTLSGSIRFGIDNRLSFVSATPMYDSFQNDSMTWSFTDFTPLETMTYDVVLNIPAPTTVNIGDILSFSAIIYPVQGDMAPLDNYDELRQTVTGSYDPNDKWVSHDTLSPTQVTQAEYLNYRIRFQNTGTDTAFTVAVRDTLDQNLDWSSLQMINASHNYNLSIRGGNTLEWRFENILLPDSNTNEPQSHGYIFYRIKPKTNLALNDSIANTAAIYFDFNPPVITNTVYTEVALPVSISENTFDAALDIFPNPTNGEFTVQFVSTRSGSYNFELTDISGRVIYSQLFNHNTTTHLRPSLKLASGIYLLTIADGQSKTTRKLVIR